MRDDKLSSWHRKKKPYKKFLGLWQIVMPIDPVVNRAAMQQLDKPEVEVESCVNSNDTTTTSSVICFPDFFAVYAVQVGKDEKEVVFPPATPRFACCKKLRVDSRLT